MSTALAPFDSRLRTDEANHYAARLEALNRWRVDVFLLTEGISNVELRPIHRPMRPALVLRTAHECELVLAQECRR